MQDALPLVYIYCVCWKLHTLFNSDLVVYIHPVTDKSVKGRATGVTREETTLWDGEPPHRHTPNKYLRSVWFNVWALLGHIHSYCAAQQGKSISPLCIWGFYLFWSSLHQVGVKIGVHFSSGLLKCTWFHRLIEKWCRESNSTPCLGKHRIKCS